MEQQVIPQGYKQTEVGMIPEDWDVCCLGDRANFIGSGKTNTKSKGEYPLYGSTGLIGSCTSPEYEGEAILVARVGANAGRLNFITGEYGVSDNTILIKLKPENIIQYFKYWLVRKNLNSLVFGSGQPLITGTQIKELLLPLPTVQEQTAIATVLSDVDSLIASLERLIAKKQAIKTATMQQLLTGKTRLPAFSHHPDGQTKGTKQSDLGEIPEDWGVVSLGSFIKSVIDNRGKTPPLTINGFPMVEVNAVFKQGRHPNLGKVSKYVSKSTFSNWFRDGHPKAGDILVVTVGLAGETSYVESEGFCIAQNLIALVLHKSCYSEFIYYLTQSTTFKKQVDAVLMGGVQPSLKVPHINKFIFVVPVSLEEQTTIATTLSDMDTEIQTLQQRLDKTQQLKQGMMQELLTGRTRLV